MLIYHCGCWATVGTQRGVPTYEMERVVSKKKCMYDCTEVTHYNNLHVKL